MPLPMPFGHNAAMVASFPRRLYRLRSAGLLGAAVLCWLAQYASAQHAAAQVAPLFQAAIAVAWAMLLLWLWTRWRGIALFAQGASLLSALWGGALFTLQWGCIYLAVDRQPLPVVALGFGLTALALQPRLLTSTVWPGAATGASWLPGLASLVGLLLLGAWSWSRGQGAAWLLSAVAAGSFALGLRQARCARMLPQDLLRWRFYQLCVAALLLPLLAVAFSPSWNFEPDAAALGAMLLQAVCGGLIFPFVLAAALPALPQTRDETPRGAHVV